MISDNKQRILFFSGHGGAGKTTIAAATAIKVANAGYHTLLLSADTAHSLGTVLQQRLSAERLEPTSLTDKLDVMEISSYATMKQDWPNLRTLLVEMLKRQESSQVAAEELAALPGMEEATALIWLDHFHQRHNYDFIVVDSAPTGETLAFVTLPQTVQSFIQNALPFQQALIRGGGAWVRNTMGLPVDLGYDELQTLYERLNRMRDTWRDATLCTTRLVVNPDQLSLREVQRKFAYLQIYQYPVDGLIINRILPNEGMGEFFNTYRQAQQNLITTIEDSFAPLPILRSLHQGQEVCGLEALAELGDALYGEHNPTQLTTETEATYRLTQQDESYVLSLKTPNLKRGEFSLRQFDDEVVIIYADERERTIFLPKFLAYYQPVGYRLSDGWLRIRFSQR